MERNLNHRFSVGELANMVNLSYWHFCRLFRAETGSSPARYFKNLKRCHSIKLLEQTFLTVKEIARLIGVDESHFVREFRTIYDNTPSRYRSTVARQRMNLVARNSANGNGKQQRTAQTANE